jgi:hypothetical protein
MACEPLGNNTFFSHQISNSHQPTNGIFSHDKSTPSGGSRQAAE